MKLVIIGNGIAGVTLARLVADASPGTTIDLYSAEPHTYYPRPKLVDLLAGKVQADKMAGFPPDWYIKRGIITHLEQRVAAIEPAEHRIILADGAAVPYDWLVLATGAHAWVPPTPGSDLANVFTLRTLDDALALRRAARADGHAVALGGGLLGLDTCGALLASGIAITVVEMMPRLLPRQLDAEGAAVLQSLLEKRGLRFITDDVAAAIEGDGRVERVRLKGGAVLEADLVLVSAGVRANLSLAKQAGLNCNRGIVVDERMATSAEDVWAIGDCAEYSGRIWGIIPAALAQARVAAAQITGSTSTLYEDIVPSTTLKVTDIDLSSAGEVNPEGLDVKQLRRTDAEAGAYRKLVLRDGVIVGAIVLGERKDVRTLDQLMARRVDVSAHMARLLDPTFDLASLLE
jgi:nitrite reductase (NADH) large subunit